MKAGIALPNPARKWGRTADHLPPHLEEERLAELRRDRALVDRCLQKDEDAWEEIVTLYSKRIYNLAWRFTASIDEAEDLTQEAFIRAFMNLYSFRSETGSLRSWLLRVARNLAIDHYRKGKQLRGIVANEEIESLSLEDLKTPDPYQAAEWNEACRSVRKGMMILSREVKRAVELRDIHGYSYQEIAEAAGVSEGTVKSRISRGREKVARFLIKRQIGVRLELQEQAS